MQGAVIWQKHLFLEKLRLFPVVLANLNAVRKLLII